MTRWIAALMLLAGLGPARLGAAPSPLTTMLFVDGFESGDLCAWSGGGGCPAPPAVSGTWVGSLDLAGPRPVAFELVQRADGTLLGYLLGATPYRTVVTGSYAAGTLELELALANRESSRTVMVTMSWASQSVSSSIVRRNPPTWNTDTLPAPGVSVMSSATSRTCWLWRRVTHLSSFAAKRLSASRCRALNRRSLIKWSLAAGAAGVT